MDIYKKLKEQILIMDGSMGALLQKRGLPSGYAPDLWNTEKPEAIASIHREYIQAGADIIITNTFGATRFRLSEFGAEDKVKEINHAAAKIAKKEAKDRVLVAGDMAATGKTIAPLGDVPFEEVVDAYYEQAKALYDAGVDLFIIETLFDIQEMKAAIIAVQQACSLPIIASMTYNTDAITDTGTDPLTAVSTILGMGVNIIGVNCSTGPENMLKVVEQLHKAGSPYICVQPNAGIPQIINGETVFPASMEYMASFGPQFVEMGANIIGGCCGTNPDYIKMLSQAVKDKQPKASVKGHPFRLTSRTKTIVYGPGNPFMRIAERINPTGRKSFASAIKQGEFHKIVKEAKDQYAAGCEIIDINVGVPLIDEVSTMQRAINTVQNAVEAPIALDSSNPESIAAGLSLSVGKPLINSISAEQERIEKLFPLAKRFGTGIIILLIGEDLPHTTTERLKIAEYLLKKAEEYGISKENLLVDCLALSISALQEASSQTLDTIQAIKNEFELPTTIGLSNVSFGLPNRKLINSTFLSMAISRGLDAAILNPFDFDSQQAISASAIVTGRDKECKRYIDRQLILEELIKQSGETKTEKIFSINETKIDFTSTKDLKNKSVGEQIYHSILEGDRDQIESQVQQALEEGIDAFTIFNNHMTPAIQELGDLFGKRKKFIPHLIAGAESMKLGAVLLEKAMLKSKVQKESKGTIIMATVQGDVHDIGKNICNLMLKNYGYEVIDLGKDVSAESIIKETKIRNADIIGLSALMTTTMTQMIKVITLAREKQVKAKIMVGGAPVTQSFATEIGADGYAADVGSLVKETQRLMEQSRV